MKSIIIFKFNILSGDTMSVLYIQLTRKIVLKFDYVIYICSGSKLFSNASQLIKAAVVVVHVVVVEVVLVIVVVIVSPRHKTSNFCLEILLLLLLFFLWSVGGVVGNRGVHSHFPVKTIFC